MVLCITRYMVLYYICVMKIENTRSQMKKGVLEMCILGIISKGEVYTSEIIDQLKSTKLILVEGTLYPLLNRLKNAGLLTYVWKESDAGPPRKYYQITDEGRSFLNALMEDWNQLAAVVDYSTATIEKQ